MMKQNSFLTIGLNVCLFVNMPIFLSGTQSSNKKSENIEQNIQIMKDSKIGWEWEVQHIDPKFIIPNEQMINHIWKVVSEMPIPDSRFEQPLTQAQREYLFWKERQDWNQWAIKVTQEFEIIQRKPSIAYIPVLKKIIEEDIIPRGASQSAYTVLSSVRCSAAFTLGILGVERKYLDRLLDSEDNLIHVGAVKAITFQLSLLSDVRQLQQFQAEILKKQRGFDDAYVQDAVQGQLGQTLGIKEGLLVTPSFKKRVLLLIHRIYLDDSSDNTLIISRWSISCAYAVLEFYRLYGQDRLRVIQIVQEHLKNQTELSSRVDLLGKLYLLGIPLTQKDFVELHKRWNIPEKWKPLTLPGVPVYNPTEFKRK